MTTAAAEPSQTLGHRRYRVKISKIKVLYSMIAILILTSAVGQLAVYRWQHQQVAKLQANLSTANKSLGSTKTALLGYIKNYSDLQVKYQDALNKLATAESVPSSQPSQADLDLTVGEALTANAGSNFGNVNIIAINITLHNSTQSSIAVSPEAYELRDASNHVFNASFISSGGFGKDFVPLQPQTITPGETVTGSIGLQISDDSVAEYTLFIGTHTYKVTATKLTDWPVGP